MATPLPTPQVSVERQGAVAILSFANPPGGAMANKGAAQLRDALAASLADDGVRAIVLTGGQAGIFIRHADVGQISRGGDALAEGRIDLSSFSSSPFIEVGEMLDNSIKPVIAAINGICMGGGLELALACTVRVASPQAQSIGLPEIRIDIFPGAGGIARLAQLIGMHRARLFILRGAVVPATEALSLGIVDEVAKCALDRALEIAHDFAGREPAAIRAIMQLAREGSSPAEVGVAFGRLLRDVPSVRHRLAAFQTRGERLEEI